MYWHVCLQYVEIYSVRDCKKTKNVDITKYHFNAQYITMWHDHAWSQTFNKSLGSGIESGLRAASYSRSQGQKKTGTHRLQSNSLLVSLNHTPEMPDGKTSAGGLLRDYIVETTACMDVTC